MKSTFNLTALLALSAFAVADDSDACEVDTLPAVKEAVASTSSSTTNYVPVLSDVDPAVNATEVYAPLPKPGLDRHDNRYVVPQKNVSCYYTANNTREGHMDVNHTMKYPSVMLEQIAAIINVDCTADSVAMTFNDTTVFEKAQSSWASSNKPIVLVTNHLGDCDSELERSFFLASSITFDDSTLVATAGSTKANISTVATYTEISFGHIAAEAPSTNAKRDLILDPSYSLTPSFALADDTILYEYDPYLTVTADNASFTSNITFSGYLRYNWLLWKLEDLYFDVDTGFTAELAISADVQAAYNTSFTYSPPSLYYGVSVPGILELGPMLQFSIGTELAASAAANISTDFKVGLADGNVHIDALHSTSTGVSGWVPTYSADANINGQIAAAINPFAVLTVEIAAKAFGGIIDLSTGLTAKPGFDNTFTLTGGVGVDLGGVKNITNVDCSQGLEISSNFTFSLDAFATQWYSATLYEVNVPLVDKCYSWA